MAIYYVCDVTGSDENNGSLSEPFKTIQTASNIAQPGDSIFVQPGVYRERVSPPRGGFSGKPIVYKSVIKNKAIIRGSVEWKPQSVTNNIHSGPLHMDVFSDTSAIDGACPFLVPCTVTPYRREGRPEYLNGNNNADPNLSYSLGQVFVDDHPLVQLPYRVEMEQIPNSWWYDITENVLYVHIESPFTTIEITNQRRVFAPHIRGLKYIVVDGFIIERCGNQYPNKFWVQSQNQQAGMIGTRSGKYWTIQNNIIRHAASVGIDWGNEGGITQDLEKGTNGTASGSYGHVIENNVISDNGAAGTASYMGKKFVFSKNIVEGNNSWLYYGKQRWESAGLKVHCPSESMISQNIIRHNYCNGIWSDQGAGQNSVFQNNIIIGNEENGINFEIGSSTTGKVLNNIFDGNQYNIAFVTSGGCLVAHNLFLSSKKGDIYTCIFNRTTDKWDSLCVEIYYNLFFDSTSYMLLSASSPTASRFMNYNQYSYDGRFLHLPDTKNKIVKVFKDWQTTWYPSNGGKNIDEESIIVEGSYEMDELNCKIGLDCILKPMPFINRPDITCDYYGTKWSSDNCVAGPFIYKISNLNEKTWFSLLDP